MRAAEAVIRALTCDLLRYKTGSVKHFRKA